MNPNFAAVVYAACRLDALAESVLDASLGSVELLRRMFGPRVRDAGIVRVAVCASVGKRHSAATPNRHE